MLFKLKYKFRTDWADVVYMDNDSPSQAAERLVSACSDMYNIVRCEHLYDGLYDIWYLDNVKNGPYRVRMERTPILEIDGVNFILQQDFNDDSVML